MKFSGAIFTALLAATSAFASGNDIIQARQAKIARSFSVDACAHVNADLLLPQLLNRGNPTNTGHIDVTLCVSMLRNFCAQNQVAKTASLLVGIDVVVNILTDLIKKSDEKHECQLPEHGHSTCSKQTPCSFGCHDGFEPYNPPGTLHPIKCYCAPGKMECNGQCGSFPNGCGSAVPKPPSKRNHRRGDGRCGAEESVCGVEGGKGWDCVDTKSNKESCGGCMVPSPFATDKFVQGKDCTAIDHIAPGGVDCLGNACFVHTCNDGFVASKAHDACVPKQ